MLAPAVALLVLLAPSSAQDPADSPPAAGRPAPASRPSLEAWLRRAREREAAERERLRPEVSSLLDRLVALDPNGPPAAAVAAHAARVALAELGPGTAPLLVAELDPGPDPDADAVRRAYEATRALEPIVSAAVTEPLVALARGGSPVGRRNAVHLLGFSAEPATAGAVVSAIYRSSADPSLGRVALAALARLGVAAYEPLFGEALSSSDPELVDSALGALTEAASANQAPAVLALLRGGGAVRHVEALLAYHLACPAVVGDEAVGAWLDLVASYRLKSTQSVEVLEALPLFEAAGAPAARKRLEELAESRYPSIKEAALLCLALLGDRGARRELLRRYDETVDELPNLADSYRQRAEILLRLGDYDKAAKDYRKALQQDVQDRDERDALLVGMARCYALADKLKLAAEALREAWLDPSERAALAADPDFAALRAHAKYGEVLR